MPETTISRTNSRRENQLQFLRFVAFFCVFADHADTWKFFEFPPLRGEQAVSFFLILGGLVTGYSYYGRDIQLGAKEICKHVWNKVRKIYPLYFFTTVLTLIYSGIPAMIVEQNYTGIGALLKNLLCNLLLIQAWLPGNHLHFNGVGWYMSCMMFLYALNLPIMYLLNKVDKHPKRYVLFVFLLGSFMFGTAAFCYLTQSYDMSYWHLAFPPARMGEYLAGMVLGVMLRIIKPQIQNGKIQQIIFTIAEIIAVIYWLKAGYSPGNYWRNYSVSWLIPNMVLLAVFTVGAGWVSQLFCWRPLVRLGDISFECYLIHQIILKLYMFSNFIPETSQTGKIVSFLYCLFITLMLSSLLNPGKKNASSKKLVVNT